jgi:hypothetical protein
VIEITKAARPATYSRHGQPITYTYRVTNTGNLRLTDVTVTDTRFGALPCPRRSLAPGASMTCTSVHLISAADLSAGSIPNTATAASRQPNGQRVPSLPAHALVTGVKAPAPPPAPPVTPPEVPVTG